MSRHALSVGVLATSAAMTMAGAALAQSLVSIPGGGAASPATEYAGPLVVNNANPTPYGELYGFNLLNPQFAFQYFYASSGRGQAAFAGNNPRLLQYTGSSQLPSVFYFVASGLYLSGFSGSYSNGFSYGYGLKDADGSVIPGVSPDYTFNGSITGSRLQTDGALIQLPMLGVGIGIPAAPGNPAVTRNGVLHLTDADLCGIFSGAIKTFSAISNPLNGLIGNIDVFYRADSSGDTFLFTNHLKAVCTAPNSTTAFSNALQSTAPTTRFATLFAGYTTDANGNTFVPNGTFSNNNGGSIGDGALATAMAGTVTTSGSSTIAQPPDTQSIGYLGSDFTDISNHGSTNGIAAPNPPGGYINSRSLFVAALLSHEQAGNAAFLTPTQKNIALSFKHAGAGSTNVTPPRGKQLSNPLNWVPTIPVVTEGYPIVGYSTWDLAQCYANANVASGLVAFLNKHLTGHRPLRDRRDHGYILPSAGYTSAITNTFLNGGPMGIEQAGANAHSATCKAVTGR